MDPASYRPLPASSGGNGWLRSLVKRKSRKLLLLGLVVVAMISLLSFSPLKEPLADWSNTRLPGFLSQPRTTSTCSPEEYADGRWIYRPYYSRPNVLTKTYDKPWFDERRQRINMTRSEDVHTFTRFEKCASSREYWWHLAADQPAQFDRFPGPTEWEWVPGGRCSSQPGLRDWDREEVVRELVEGGGWLLVGDSVTENHFFSLSCLLYPHVIGRPDYNALTTMYDRAWPQHLYLDPASPLLESLKFPVGFNVSSTPLVTFRRVDLLWSQDDLKTMHRELHPEYYDSPDFQLFGTEAVWTLSPKEYFDIFDQPLPLGNYATMVVSTAGHWTTNLFHGYHHDAPSGSLDQSTAARQPIWGYDGLVQLYQEVMARWAEDVQERMRLAQSPPPLERRKTSPGPLKRDRQVLVRAYLPGHEDCHKQRDAWDVIKPFEWNWWNWAEIYRFNDVFKNLLSNRARYPDIHYLGIDRPARLRPDAHSTGDCLHVMSGAGVLEGWSHYIWHYITRES